MPEPPKLLVVDDDRMLLDFAARSVRSLGYACVTAQQAPEAQTVLSGDPEIAVLVTDLHLARQNGGLALAQLAQQVRPGLKILMTSGDAPSLVAAQRELGGAVEILPKPYRRRDLAARLSGLLGGITPPARRP
jgi:CheY-like chemotaxis protein